MLFLPRFTPPTPPAPPEVRLPQARICPICTFVVTAASGWVQPWGPASKTFLHPDCHALAYALVMAAPTEGGFLRDVVRARELARVGVRHAPDALAMKRALREKRLGDRTVFDRITAGLPAREVTALIEAANDLGEVLAGLATDEALDALERQVLEENEAMTALERVVEEKDEAEFRVLTENAPDWYDPEAEQRNAAARDAYYGDLGVDRD
jgi:hypothetical protein